MTFLVSCWYLRILDLSKSRDKFLAGEIAYISTMLTEILVKLLQGRCQEDPQED